MTDIDAIITILRREVKRFQEPIVTTISRQRDPFKVLISCLLSLRTKDGVTAAAAARLFEMADTPAGLVKAKLHKIEKAIYPVGFYKTKAARIKEICRVLIEEHDSRVPDDIDELLKLNGVGRKTANLVVTLGYGKPGICVDTHVHRISNRLGYVKTKTPEQTEFALRRKLPKKHWIIYNDLLVAHGQNICAPISPKCSECGIYEHCRRVGVGRRR